MSAPLLVAAVAVALRAIFECVFTFAEPPPGIAYRPLLVADRRDRSALPIALLAGLLRARLARASVGDLVMTLERRPRRSSATRSPGRSAIRHSRSRSGSRAAASYVDPLGRPARPCRTRGSKARCDEARARRAAVCGARPRPDAARGAASSSQAAGAARDMALENVRLQAEVRAQLVEVEESRARIVAAGDEERRRIERDLHDGAQQRLVALALELRSAQRQLGDESTPRWSGCSSRAVAELQVAVEELRELAHGVHPTILTRGGLAPARSTRSSAGAAPGRRGRDARRAACRPEVEATAYFVACEALANAVKHARASEAIDHAPRARTACCVVEVDGRRRRRRRSRSDGSGLRGLADRRGGASVAAWSSRARLAEERASCGEIPCGS